MNRVLGLDVGEKRIGVAISDPLGFTAQILPFIPNSPQLCTAIKSLVDQYDIQLILIGLPKNRDGSDSEKAKEIRGFAEILTTYIPIKIEFWDERFSTQAVTRHLISANVKRQDRKNSVDSQAAAFILQGYIDRQAFIRKSENECNISL